MSIVQGEPDVLQGFAVEAALQPSEATGAADGVAAEPASPVVVGALAPAFVLVLGLPPAAAGPALPARSFGAGVPAPADSVLLVLPALDLGPAPDVVLPARPAAASVLGL